jgi:DNA-binding MarR family transcriptional regulator
MLSTIDAAKATKAMKSVNSYQTLNELTEELGLEKLVYGGYAIRGKWNPLTKDIAWIKIQPFDTIRTNKQKTQFYISSEWTAEMSLSTRWKKGRGFPPNTITLPKFNPANKEGEFIFYVCDSRPQMKVYPLPEYEGGIAPIETDVEVKNFDLNNVKSGFAAGTMITFFDGEVENEEEQVKLERDIKGKVAGTDNGGEILLNWQMPGTAAPVITQLRTNELANQFEQLDPRVTSSIIMAHAITSPMLFGIKTEGQLGGRSELRTAWEHFYNTYVKPKQTKLEQDVNYIMSFFGLPENCYSIIGLEPIGIEIDLPTIQAALDPEEFKEYLREKLGIKKKDTYSKQKFAEDKLLFELTNKLGVKAEEYQIVMKGMGYDFEAPSNLEGDNLKVYDALTEKPKISIAELAEITNIREAKILQILENLNKANYIGLKITEVNGRPQIESKISIVEPEEQERGFILETKWRYEGPKDSRNRDFCSKMLAANRLYTRAEIDQLENDMEEYNTSVWRYRGGWYHNPSLDVNTPQCRHFWEQVLTKKRA